MVLVEEFEFVHLVETFGNVKNHGIGLEVGYRATKLESEGRCCSNVSNL